MRLLHSLLRRPPRQVYCRMPTKAITITDSLRIGVLEVVGDSRQSSTGRCSFIPHNMPVYPGALASLRCCTLRSGVPSIVSLPLARVVSQFEFLSAVPSGESRD